MTKRSVLLLTLVAGCSGASKPSTGAPSTADAAPAAAQTDFAGVPLGEPLVDDDLRFEPPIADYDRRVMRSPVAFAGRQPTVVEVRVDAGIVVEVAIKYAADGAAAADELVGWGQALCRELGGEIDEHTPSPVGTPPPDGDWDPVILTIGKCDVSYNGRAAHIRTERAHTHAHHRGDVIITIYANRPAE